ncbi:BEACH domain-containing protein, partial [Baffinella frigidus]
PQVPPFHYGSFYSTSAHVLHFLVRFEPFTTHHRALQEGRFDIPDRLFHSVAESWLDTAGNRNLSDVKELTPEFYYSTEFLSNPGNLPLGTRQDGERVGDVQLPPWARGSPAEFIRQHRAALESPHVTAHLHEWVDLVFGFRQRGPPAVAATNVFYYLTYDGVVDTRGITDPVQREALEAQMQHFGQCPHQLFTKAHPVRKARPSKSALSDPQVKGLVCEGTLRI